MSTPPERRRRSPGGSGIPLTAEEQLPTSMHPFLDLEKSEPRTNEASSSLLQDWVPGTALPYQAKYSRLWPNGHTTILLGAGVPEYSHESSAQKVPYTQASSNTFVGSHPPSKKKGSKKLTGAIAVLGLLIVVLIAFLALRRSKKATVSKALDAIGEGESREDFVRVQGNEVGSLTVTIQRFLG